MRVNSMYTEAPKSYNNSILNKNVKISGFYDGNKNNSDKDKKDINKDNETSGSISLLKNQKEDLIKNLQEQIERIKKNDELDDKTKKVKIETLQKQIEEIQKEDNKKKIEELAKLIKGEDEKLAEKRKEKAEREAKAKGSDLEVSMKGFINLIKADKKLEQAQDMEVLKAKMESEEYMLSREIDFDKKFQSEQLAVRKDEKISLNEFLKKPNNFDGEFTADVSDKTDKLLEKSNAINNIEKLINNIIGKANTEVEKAQDKANEKTTDEKKTEEAENETAQDEAVEIVNDNNEEV